MDSWKNIKTTTGNKKKKKKTSSKEQADLELNDELASKTF